MSEEWKNNISFVLVGPREAGNIGSSARALKNMGFPNLCLVAPRAAVSDEARWFAHNAEDILDRTTVSPTIAEAVADRTLVVGTTRRTGKRRGIIRMVDEAAESIRRHAEHGRAAILFGREDRGLYNDEAAECGFLITIPANDEQPSLNLGQAVLVVAYELARAGRSQLSADDRSRDEAHLIDKATLAALFERIGNILKLLEYIPRGDLDLEMRIMANLKQYIGRAGVKPWELNMMHGICSRIEKRLVGPERVPSKDPAVGAAS